VNTTVPDEVAGGPAPPDRAWVLSGLADALRREAKLLMDLREVLERQRRGVAEEDLALVDETVYSAQRIFRTLAEARRRAQGAGTQQLRSGIRQRATVRHSACLSDPKRQSWRDALQRGRQYGGRVAGGVGYGGDESVVKGDSHPSFILPRKSFAGGGSDLEEYYKHRKGLVVSTTFDKYVYITVNKRFSDSIRVSYSNVEFAEGSFWRLGGLSTDPSYLQDEVNIKLTEDGHLVGKMAYFTHGVKQGEHYTNRSCDPKVGHRSHVVYVLHQTAQVGMVPSLGRRGRGKGAGHPGIPIDFLDHFAQRLIVDRIDKAVDLRHELVGVAPGSRYEQAGVHGLVDEYGVFVLDHMSVILDLIFRGRVIEGFGKRVSPETMGDHVGTADVERQEPGGQAARAPGFTPEMRCFLKKKASPTAI